MKVKICGLRRFEDIDYVNEFLPDYAGFIFAPQSKRYITSDFALKLKKNLNEKIKSVGVFVNENLENIRKIADLHIIDLIQLHGDEKETFTDKVKSTTNLPVIKAFKADENLRKNINFTKADFVLIDSCQGNKFGGTGTIFDWSVIPESIKGRLFLAGGINSSNIREAMKINPYCLDINSGVETDGFKDKIKIKEVFEIIKETEYE